MCDLLAWIKWQLSKVFLANISSIVSRGIDIEFTIKTSEISFGKKFDKFYVKIKMVYCQAIKISAGGFSKLKVHIIFQVFLTIFYLRHKYFNIFGEISHHRQFCSKLIFAKNHVGFFKIFERNKKQKCTSIHKVEL